MDALLGLASVPNPSYRQSARRWLGVAALLTFSSCSTVPPASREPPLPRSPLVEPPGAVNEDVTQATIRHTICRAGWTATVRPPTGYTQPLKLKMLREAGLPASEAPKYELDHFIPLALGGHPRSPDNLWLQRWHGEWGAGVKDVLERRLQVRVCNGEMDLSVARLLIQHDWRAALVRYVENARDVPMEADLMPVE
ncbi:MAG TPA: hypothetical protein VNU71_03645 [Burkholderiaceae bacterium]|nr:hypothetical protein [Burkholderiaceae bacterium]